MDELDTKSNNNRLNNKLFELNIKRTGSKATKRANQRRAKKRREGKIPRRRKRDRTAVKMEDGQMIKRQKELQDPCDPMLDDCFPKDVSELLKVELKESSAPVLPKDLRENLDNPVSSQSSESDDESDDEFDP